ncbi:MAG: sigma-70 family RNA polymerase sigma factor, partial [Bacteroidaceae bacterium]|nr:sigma-70 family RNA polymerase sigma factor [Bacteroidaceae bacterium]
RLALRVTLDRAEAEDVVQETMIRVWEKREELKNVDSIEAFCLTICRNLALDKQAKKEAQSVELDEMIHDKADLSTPYEDLVQTERLSIIKRLFDSLPIRQREVIQLRDIEGKSYKEIASVLGQTEDQVRVNLFRARQKLREQYINIENYGL